MTYRRYSEYLPRDVPSVYRNYGVASFTILNGTFNSVETLGLGAGRNFAIWAPASEATKTLTITTSYDGTNFATVTTVTRVSGMNFFTGTEGDKMYCCQDTRFSISAAPGSNVTFYVFVKG